jgi:HAD superfamily hydrolase (TIGR01509 family)
MGMNLWNFDAFVFDLDGTLIDSGKYHAQAFAHAVLEECGYRLTPGEHHEFFANHSIPFSRVLNNRHGLRLDPERVLEHKRKRMEEIFQTDLFEGAREFLEKWKGIRPMGLATNSPASFVGPALEEADLAGFFDSITTADEVTHRKPDPEMIEIAIQKLQANPLDTLVFEDQLMGVDAALGARAQVVVVDNGQRVVFPETVPVMTWKALLDL